MILSYFCPFFTIYNPRNRTESYNITKWFFFSELNETWESKLRRTESIRHQREAVFAEFVGPLALEHKKAPLAVTVDRFAREWVPPGAVKVPSMLKVTPLSSDSVRSGG